MSQCLLALNLRCFVVNVLFVAILLTFQCNFVVKVRFYWDNLVKMGENGCNFG